MPKNSGVSKHWWYVLIIVVIVLLSRGHKEIADNGGLQIGSAPDPRDAWCANADNIRMDDDQRRMVVTAKPDCWSGWITVPTTTDQFWIFPEKGSTVEIEFIDGTYVLDHPDRGPLWTGESTGIFRLRAVGEPVKVTITIRFLS